VRFNPNDERESVYPNEEMKESYEKSCYNWQPTMEDKILRVTKSSLGTFEFCPLQYYYQNVLGIRGEQKDYHIRGSNIHDAIEWYWKESRDYMDGALKLLEKGDKESARMQLRKAIPEPPEPYVYGEKAQILKYTDWMFERLLNIDESVIEDWYPIGNEAEIHATRTVTASDGTVVPIHMKGFIDRMFRDDDGKGVVLMELKSGKYTKYKPKAMRDEMQFYRMMLEHSSYLEYTPVVAWGWAYPGGGINGGDGPKFFYESVHGRGPTLAPKRVEKNLVKLVDAHLKNEWDTKHNKSCSDFCNHEKICLPYCDFVDMCPAWTGECYAPDYTIFKGGENDT
tara:strand:- start:6568 stop:7584 length:1017 start_codon:yes stop_codon:yes gene_type:complete